MLSRCRVFVYVVIGSRVEHAGEYVYGGTKGVFCPQVDVDGVSPQQHANTPDQQPQQTAPDRFYSLLQHMVQSGMTAPYAAAAAQFAAQNGEAAGPLKAAEAGKEAAVVPGPGPPYSPPPAALPLNGIDQQTSLVVSTVLINIH